MAVWRHLLCLAFLSILISGCVEPRIGTFTGSPDINVSVNSSGTGFVQYNATNNVTMLCTLVSSFPIWCEPQYQDNTSGVFILQVTNNGSANSTWRAVNLNWTLNGSLWCGTNASPTGAGNINVTTTPTNYSLSNLTPTSSEGVYCHYNASGSSGHQKFQLNFTDG